MVGVSDLKDATVHRGNLIPIHLRESNVSNVDLDDCRGTTSGDPPLKAPIAEPT